MIHDDWIACMRALSRAAHRAGRTFIVFLAGAAIFALGVVIAFGLVSGLASCQYPDKTLASPDAAERGPGDAFITQCVTDAGTFEVACGSAGAVVCSREGVVQCDVPDAGVLACCRR